MRILFVCLGNICRSCTAEEIMRTYLTRKGLDREIEVDSAGTLAYHQGELPDSRMQKHAARRGYELTHISRPVLTQDFYNFDLLIGMDENNIANLIQMAPSPEESKKIFRMVDFLQHRSADHIPDPYYGGSAGFENVLDLLEDACAGLIQQITAK